MGPYYLFPVSVRRLHFVGGGLAHRSSGGLQAGKVRTGKRVPRMGQVRGTRLLGPGPVREEVLGSRMREEGGAPGLHCSMKEKEEETGVVA